MRQIIVGVAAIIFMAGCTCPVQQQPQGPPMNASEDTIAVLEAGLAEWFSSNYPHSEVKSGVVHLQCAALDESDQLDIPGVKVIVDPSEDMQLNKPGVRSFEGYWVRVTTLAISGDTAKLNFFTKNEEYHKWCNVTLTLKRIDEGWTVIGFGTDM